MKPPNAIAPQRAGRRAKPVPTFPRLSATQKFVNKRKRRRELSLRQIAAIMGRPLPTTFRPNECQLELFDAEERRQQ